MPKMKRPRTQSFLAITLFIFSIIFGMQIATEKAKGQISIRPPLGSEPTAAPSQTSEQAQQQPQGSAQPPPPQQPSQQQPQQPSQQQPQQPSQQQPQQPSQQQQPAQIQIPPELPDDINYEDAIQLIEQYRATDQMQQQNGNIPGNAQPRQGGRSNFVPSEVQAYFPSRSVSEPLAKVQTSLGSFTIKLFYSRTPATVQNFISLARGERSFTDVKTSKRTQRPFYNGLIFHRVLPGMMIQGGCPLGTGKGGPGFTIPDEKTDQLQFSKAGMVAMAPALDGTKPMENANGSQFFITLKPQPEWNGLYTIFGEVTSGLEVVRKISMAKAGPTDRPIRRIYIHSIEIIDDPSQASKPSQAPTKPGQ